MIFYDVTQAVIGNLHDLFMISDPRFLLAEILMLKSAQSTIRFARFPTVFHIIIYDDAAVSLTF